jgi:hypothetical protein
LCFSRDWEILKCSFELHCAWERVSLNVGICFFEVNGIAIVESQNEYALYLEMVNVRTF